MTRVTAHRFICETNKLIRLITKKKERWRSAISGMQLVFSYHNRRTGPEILQHRPRTDEISEVHLVLSGLPIENLRASPTPLENFSTHSMNERIVRAKKKRKNNLSTLNLANIKALDCGE